MSVSSQHDGARGRQSVSVSSVNVCRESHEQLDLIVQSLQHLLGQSIIALQECQGWPSDVSHQSHLCLHEAGHYVALL
eukprot:9125737-Alexandrium_andersonii.AAC.1